MERVAASLSAAWWACACCRVVASAERNDLVVESLCARTEVSEGIVATVVRWEGNMAERTAAVAIWDWICPL